MFQRLDLTDKHRVFVVGDIHGEFDILRQELAKLGFQNDTDHLLSVGDLVDRGPKSEQALLFLEQPWFDAVRGNHEQMVIDAGGTSWHVVNGGYWFNKLEPDEKSLFVKTFQQLPLAIEAALPNGKRIGICHASYPATKQNGNKFITDWNDMEVALTKSTYHPGYLDIIWDRYQVGRAKKHFPRLHKLAEDSGALREFNISNIDHVYFGHTPLSKPLTIGNCTWLDTGAFATGTLTVLEVTSDA